LDTFAFDIELGEDKSEAAKIAPGSKEWVGRDTTRSGLGLGRSAEDSLGLGGMGFGGPRNQRTPGEAVSFLSELQGRRAQREEARMRGEENKNVASALVERLKRMTAEQAGQA
jgi:hypothetical protein